MVASPHVYGPSISLATGGYLGAELYTRLSQAWGYLNVDGYCSRTDPTNCHRFPIVIGEFGELQCCTPPSARRPIM